MQISSFLSLWLLFLYICKCIPPQIHSLYRWYMFFPYFQEWHVIGQVEIVERKKHLRLTLLIICFLNTFLLYNCMQFFFFISLPFNVFHCVSFADMILSSLLSNVLNNLPWGPTYSWCNLFLYKLLHETSAVQCNKCVNA